MDTSQIAPLLMKEAAELVYALYDGPPVPLFYVGLLGKTRHIFFETDENGVPWLEQEMALPKGSCSIAGLDVDGTREQNGIVVMMEMEDGSDIDFTVTFRFDRAKRQMVPVLTKSVNTSNRSTDFEGIEEACETALRAWLDRALGPINRPIQRCLACKEEIMMRAWHPDRVLRLLEAGIDVEEM